MINGSDDGDYIVRRKKGGGAGRAGAMPEPVLLRELFRFG